MVEMGICKVDASRYDSLAYRMKVFWQMRWPCCRGKLALPLARDDLLIGYGQLCYPLLT